MSMRILAGEFKGRVLLSPPKGVETRPITGATKKSLFDTLADRLVDATVLDLYCGTGTIGLEALSRGAGHCCFADRDRRVLERLRRNMETLRAGDQCTVWRGDVPGRLAAWLKALGRCVDVAFVDPPYAQARQWDWEQIGRRLFTPLAAHMADDGMVVLRTPPKLKVPETLADLHIGRVRAYGSTALHFLEPTTTRE